MKYNKGDFNMFKKIFNNLQEKYNDKKEENNHYKQLLETTTTFQNLFPIPNTTIKPCDYKITYITNDSPDLNKEKAKIIACLIPLEETYLTTIYSKEILTNQEYYLIPTNKYLWIINQKTYGAFPYQNLKCEIIKHNLMGKTILINNILLDANGTDSKIQQFLSIINNPTEREKIIQEKISYLCGIIPIYQKINNIQSGISIDANSNIVFHTKQWNYKFHYSEIECYEILLDNQVTYSSKSTTANKITNFQNSCYQISMRIEPKNKKTLIIPILEPNSFNTKYQRQDTIFQTNLNFAKEIIDKIENLNPNQY